MISFGPTEEQQVVRVQVREDVTGRATEAPVETVRLAGIRDGLAARQARSVPVQDGQRPVRRRAVLDGIRAIRHNRSH